MAKNILIRRKTGVDTYEVLYPQTTIGQVENLSSTLATYVPLSQKGALNGVATLDSNGYIPASQLSAYIRGGVRITGAMGNAAGNSSVEGLINQLISIVTNSNGHVQYEELVGYGWIAAQNFNIIEGTIPANHTYTINPGDEGDATPPIDLESGDMLIVSNYNLSGTTHQWTLAVINNNYREAGEGVLGLVQYGQIGSLQDLDSNSAVLRGVDIYGFLVGGDQNGATTDGFAMSGHTHSNYQPVNSNLNTLSDLSASAIANLGVVYYDITKTEADAATVPVGAYIIDDTSTTSGW